MPLNPTEPTVSAPSRVALVVVAGVAVVALLFAVAMLTRPGKSPGRNRVETAAGDDQTAPNQPPSRPTVPQVTNPAEPTPGAPAPPTDPSPISNPPAATAPTSGRATPAEAAASNTPSAAFTGPARPTIRTGQEPTTPEPAGSTGSTEPTGSTGGTEGPSEPQGSTEVTVEPTSPTSSTGSTEIVEITGEPTTPTGPTEEQRRCANLRLVAVGDPAPGDVAAESAKTRFRSAMVQIPPTEDLVCGKPVASYLDDLLIQRIQVAGNPHGILVGGSSPSDPVLWLSEVEWTSYKWRSAGPTNHNFTGVPVGRVTIGGYQMIRTSRGAVVMVRSDSWGYTVVGGAWDVWMTSGGPSGPMGLPEAKAIGVKDFGAKQDFTNGVLALPGVSSELEAEVMPASRYEWVPLTAEQMATPSPAPNSIADIDGVSYYVDRAGVRHWLDSTSAWSCARYNLGAPTTAMSGWQAARSPLGPVFICPANPPA